MCVKRICLVFVPVILVVLLPGWAVGGVDPSLEWKTISTEHFDVHYHVGAEWTARQVADIVEEIHPHVTGLYKYDPGRVNFIVKDTDDYANGAAFYYDNKIEIWATNLEFGFRGTTEWLRNVVTHEYIHMVSIQAAMKMPFRIPAVYFQMIGFEDEKRPDVLTGYPNNITSYPFVGAVVPPWFAEGVSQYQTPNLRTDCWDTHRDMILRAAILEDKMLSYDEMGFLGHRSLGNEQVYDHGYGLVRYIAQTYGPESIERITRELGAFERFTVDGALKKVTGKDGRELYSDWQDYLRARYRKQVQRVRENPREGWVLSDHGYMSLYPSFSPDGKRVAFLSNKGSDYSGTSLYVIDRDGGGLKRIKAAVSSRGVFSPDGKKLLYARHRKVNVYDARVSDIHVYDFETKKENRLTKKLRAAEPSYSPDGRHIVCVVNADGTHHLVTMDAGGENVKTLYKGEKGTQFYGPVYSPRGDRIMFGIFRRGTREIAVIDTDGRNFEYLVKTQNDERDARWLPGGDGIVFTSDRTGIFNVYTMRLADRRFEQLTNVIGGAFAPDVSPTDGSLVYSGYNGDGYHIALVDPTAGVVAEMDEAAHNERETIDSDDCVELKNPRSRAQAASGRPAAPASTPASATAATASAFGAEESLPASGANPTEPEAARDYKSTYTHFQVFPRVVIYDGTPRLGAFIASSEILGKQDFFAGASYGTNGEFDAFVDMDFRYLLPVVYMEFIAMREITDDNLSDGPFEFEIPDDQGVPHLFVFDALDLEVRYDLWAADIGLRLEFEDPYSLTNRNDFSLWFSHSEYRVHIGVTGVGSGGRSELTPLAWRYFIGNDIHARWRYKAVKRAVDSDINPRGGREFKIEYMRGFDELFTSGVFEYGFNPLLDKNDFNQYTVDWIEYIALPKWRHSLRLRAYGSFIDTKVDDFFYVYLGGLDGIRGYTYYTIGGRKGVIGSAAYRFPIWRRINKQLLHLTFKDVYGSVFYEVANAWKHNFEIDDFKRSAGFELRFNLGSFYSYPTTVSFASAYSMDEVVFFNPNFSREPVLHDKKWRHYLTVGFTF